MISIIVPVYKVEKYLERCIMSLVMQTYNNVEIILVDDGSPDQCPQICDIFAKKYASVKVIHKKNGGLSDARNTGLKVAQGEYVMYVDSDDYIENNACEFLVQGMKDDVDFVVGVIKEIKNEEVTYQRHTNLISGKVYDAKDFIINSIKVNEWYAPAVLNLYRRSFLINNKLYYKVGYFYEDTEMLPRLYLSAKKIVYLDYAFYNYIIRENSIITSKFTDEKRKMALDNYNDWMRIYSLLEDQEIQRYLYGVLIKYYIATAKKMNIVGWRVNGLDFRFALKYSLNIREKMKVFLFNFFPKMYMKL